MSVYKDLDGVLGFMSAPWFRTREIDVLKHFAEAKVFKVAFEKYPKIESLSIDTWGVDYVLLDADKKELSL